MTVDYAALAKTSQQHQERDNITFDEGETLICLVPSDRAFPPGHGSVTVKLHGGKINQSFGRSVVSYAQPFCKTDEYRELVDFDVPDNCPIAEHMAANFSAKERQAARAKDVTLWVLCALAHRRKPTSSWEEIYVKPQWMSAKQGGVSPHIQGELDRLISEQGANAADFVASLFDPDAAQLLIVKRTGKGQFATKFELSVATGSNDELGDLSAFCVPDEMRDDIANAIAPGGPCDLIQVVANMFSPAPDEISDKLSASSSQPGMDEIDE